MTEINYDELDPGIRDIVRILNNLGYQTTDSGDGSKYPEMGCAMPYRNVALVIEAGELIHESLPHNHLIGLFEQCGDIKKTLGDSWQVYLNWSPGDSHAIVVCEELSEAWHKYHEKMAKEGVHKSNGVEG